MEDGTAGSENVLDDLETSPDERGDLLQPYANWKSFRLHNQQVADKLKA
jgi:hypothetical protein